MTSVGTIVIADGLISVRLDWPNGTTATSIEGATIEHVGEAARILCEWMRLPSADPRREARRVHRDDQLGAFIRDMVNDYAAGLESPGEAENP